MDRYFYVEDMQPKTTLDTFDLNDLCKSYNNNKITKDTFIEMYKHDRKTVKEYLIDKANNGIIRTNNNRYFYTQNMEPKTNKKANNEHNITKDIEKIEEIEEQINVKINKKLKKKLDYICIANNISFKDLINNVLEEYANKQKLDDLTSKIKEKHNKELEQLKDIF
ncbi:TPA: hypothetical protein ACILPC_003648 [Clostridioides difficile]